MARQKVLLGTATIPTSAGAYSNVLSARELGQAVGLIFYCPAAFTGAVTVHVGPKDNNTSGELLPLRVNDVAIDLTAATADSFIVAGGFESLACKTAGTEAAPRAIVVYAVLETYS